ncbi:hypothetical protein [Sunxiuqinia rutila]|uniref:hypothetical protein n=1 Tax=Sunxiuqinia rutila TaxID=1397841 RepID=UPI003D360D0A
MHRIFLIVSIVLVVLTLVSSDKGEAFSLSPRYIMVLLTIIWLLVWAGAAIFKKILPVSSLTGILSVLGGIMLVVTSIYVYNKVDKKKREKARAAVEEFLEKQRVKYEEKELIENFAVTLPKNQDYKIDSLKFTLSLKNDSLVRNSEISLIVFVETKNENALPYEHTLFCEYMTVHLETDTVRSYQLEVPVESIQYSVVSLKKKFGNKVKLDYAIYIEGDNYIMGGRVRPGICLTSLSRETLQARDYCLNGYPYAGSYPSLSEPSLMLDTILELDQLLTK